mmetsp:Transcript_85514/g.250351  ORF Transcript_85514/g.250351 Transcript_85514/m.250351 type:complete len:201 (+) Transcript_85514:167-769(+)
MGNFHLPLDLDDCEFSSFPDSCCSRTVATSSLWNLPPSGGTPGSSAQQKRLAESSILPSSHGISITSSSPPPTSFSGVARKTSSVRLKDPSTRSCFLGMTSTISISTAALLISLVSTAKLRLEWMGTRLDEEELRSPSVVVSLWTSSSFKPSFLSRSCMSSMTDVTVLFLRADCISLLARVILSSPHSLARTAILCSILK